MYVLTGICDGPASILTLSACAMLPVPLGPWARWSLFLYHVCIVKIVGHG